MFRLWAHRLLMMVWLLSSGAVSTAWADNTADEAEVAFRQGNQAFGKRDYERALASYFLSYRLVPNRNVLFNIARCYEALKEYDQAYRYYYDLLGQKDLPAGDRRDVQRELAQLAPRVALVKVDSKPQGADVFIDREDLGSRGKTPQTLALPVGSHEVKVRLPGYHPAQATVTVSKGREVKRTFELKTIIGTVDVQGTPTGAEIRTSATGPELGKVPAVLSLPPGRHVLTVTAPGYAAGQFLVEAKADESVSVQVALTELAKATGKLIVTANRENATVRVNGKDSGFTPTVLSLPVGEYEVEVAMKDLRTYREKVVVKVDQEVRVLAELRYAPPDISAASKSLLSVDEAPASITVITAEEIRSFGYQTLTEALQMVRGIYLTDDRIYTYLGVRGFTPPGDLNTRVLILWDGHPFNDVWAGQGYAGTDLEVDLTEIERIEVVRGPGSALYGTGAFFAVINVVPRDTLPDRNLEGTVGVGGQRALKARAAGGAGGKEASVHVSAAGLLAQGAELTALDEATTVHGLDGERVLSATARARWKGFSFNGHFNQRRKAIPTAPLGALPGVAGTNYLDARAFAEGRYEGGTERFNFTARLYYDGSRYEGTFATQRVGDETKLEREFGGADWAGLEAKARFRIFGQNQLSIGLEGQGQFISQQQRESSLVERRQRFLLSAYLLDEWKITSWLLLSAGLRVDKYLDSNNLPITPRVGLVIRPYNGGLSKLVAGQAFRAPNTYEVDFCGGLASGGQPTVSLAPETITTVEVEHTHDITEELRLSVGAYFNNIDRLIEQVDTGNGSMGPDECIAFRNSATQLIAAGAETTLRWQPGRFSLVEFNYSYVQLRGNEAISRLTPAHLFSARALVPLVEGNVRLSGQALFQSSRGTELGAGAGEALLLNFGLSGDVGRLRYFAGVKNLLDTQYRVPVATDIAATSAPGYGRTFWVELALSY